ncbi:MAG: hypothetical protein LCH91_05020 [Bacteroidetes bacterium]|nr:hypothetical protein [Bacteroidota bacterium]
MNTYFWLNIHCEKFSINAPKSLLGEWDKAMNYTQNLFNQHFQNFKLKTKGIRSFSVLFTELEHVKSSLPNNPLGDTAWIHYRFIDESIMKNLLSLNQKMEFIANETYESLKLLCVQKSISSNTFESSFQWVKEHLPKTSISDL